MYEILMVVYLVVALALIGFILVQQGKGAGMGSSFGSGASGTVFGASGSGNFLTKTTTVLAIVFFGVALSLGNMTIEKKINPESNSLFPVDAKETTNPEAPAVDTELPSIPTSTESDIPVIETQTSDTPTSEADKSEETKTETTKSETTDSNQ